MDPKWIEASQNWLDEARLHACKYFRSDLQVTDKGDSSPVTSADKLIESLLRERIRSEFPDHGIIGEEEANENLISKYRWVIDPIDGTNNYALACSFCAISLALLFDGVPVYGFIYDHSTKDLLEGGVGYGLFRNQKKIDRDATMVDAQTMIGLHFPMSSKQLEKLAPLLSKYRVRCIGSGALMAAYVATGYLTGVIDYRVKVWDIAAAYALCASVGLKWVFIENSPFPLKKFHPQMNFSPYHAGAESFFDELRHL